MTPLETLLVMFIAFASFMLGFWVGEDKERKKRKP